MKRKYKTLPICLAWWQTMLMLLLWLSLFVIVPPAFGQAQITLRFIDPESGKPLKGIYGDILAGNTDKFDGTTKTIVWNATPKKTDREGKVVFQLPDPVPRYLLCSADVLDLHGCSSGVFSAKDVLRTGVVAVFDTKKLRWCGKLKTQAAAKPGEIVIFDKRMTVWERMLQEIP
jgi:hypothetical protein